MHPEHLTVKVEKEVEVIIRLHRVTCERAATQKGISKSCLSHYASTHPQKHHSYLQISNTIDTIKVHHSPY
jgi:hypothetical protein